MYCRIDDSVIKGFCYSDFTMTNDIIIAYRLMYVLVVIYLCVHPIGRPNMPELFSFSAENEILNIVEQIGANYSKFGTILLEDYNGVIVTALENQHSKDAGKINGAIFQRWLQRSDITWMDLVHVLALIEM